jgi:hypothetical protein
MGGQTASMQAWEPSGALGDTCAMGSTVTEAHHFVSSPGDPLVNARTLHSFLRLPLEDFPLPCPSRISPNHRRGLPS